MSTFKSIAIDGPAGAGKSTIAKELSKKINYLYVDTGALYRAIGFYMVNNHISTTDALSITSNLKNLKIQLEYLNGIQKVILNNKDISDQIRSPEISIAASNVSALKPVRDFLIDLQRNLAQNNCVIMDGRDIATVILPHADIKIFLTASAQIRAMRRYNQLVTNDPSITFKSVYEDMINRDKNDSSRCIAPLKQAPDAILVDSSNMSLNETIDYIFNIIKEKIL